MKKKLVSLNKHFHDIEGAHYCIREVMGGNYFDGSCFNPKSENGKATAKVYTHAEVLAALKIMREDGLSVTFEKVD
jgi:hypothetical protein